MVIDETAAMNKASVLAILPILGAKPAFVSITSKAVMPDSTVDRMKNSKLDNGEYVFRRIVYDPKCAYCRKRGVATCPHKPTVKWSSSRAKAQLRSVMSAIDSSAYRREVENEDADSEIGPVFSKASLTQLEDSEYHIGSGIQIKHVYVGVDPSGGGRMSRYAIVSVIVVEDTNNNGVIDYVVVGADFVESDNYNIIRDVVVRHVLALRRAPGLQNALIVVIPENNLGYHHFHIEEDLRQGVPRNCFHIFNVGDAGRAGVHQDNEKKRALTVSIGRNLEGGRLFIWEHLVSVGEYDTGIGAVNANAHMARTILINDLRSFMCIAKRPSKIDGRVTYIYTGKTSGSKDDGVIALGIPMLFWKPALAQVNAMRV